MHPSLQPSQPFPDDAGLVLLPLARRAIANRLGVPASATPLAGVSGSGADDDAWLELPGASFVTLTLGGSLRGCIGSLAPHRTLGEDVEANAVAAAVRDPRFPPLTSGEFEATLIEVSVLSAPRVLPVDGEADLLARLRPGVDGVILSTARHRATFLPQVWDQLPQPSDFLAHLRRKAGLPAGYWGADVEIEVYTVTAWKETEPGVASAPPEPVTTRSGASGTADRGEP